MARLWQIGLACVILGVAVAPAPADENDEAATQPAPRKSVNDGKMSAGEGIAIVGVCIAAGLSALGGGYAVAKIGSACIESMARQPEASGSMFGPMLVSAAMVEGGMLFAILVSLLVAIRVL